MASQTPPGSGTLAPLSDELRDALIAVIVLGFISCVTTTLLIVYVTYRVIKWEWITRWPSRHRLGEIDNHPDGNMESNDLSLGLEARHYHQIKVERSTQMSEPPSPRSVKAPTVGKRDGWWNPALMLIFNLLLADLTEDLAFLLSVVWVKDDGIFVPSRICWIQGWFMQTGKLVSSGMLVLISINSYLTIVKGYKASRTMVYASTAGVWLVSYMMVLGGVLGTKNGRDHGGYYVRAGAWCWVNQEYNNLRLYGEYMWIFLSMALTILLFVLVIVSLYRNNQSVRHFPSTTLAMEQRDRDEPPKPSGHHPAFLMYQVIYIVCTAPLAFGRLAAMSGVELSNAFYGVAGSIIASHGFLNVLLWSTTIIFIGDKDIHETGLDKFAMLRTPHRRYGNMVMVRGGNDNGSLDLVPSNRSFWWRLRELSGLSSSGCSSHSRTVSQESLQRQISKIPDENRIQMEVVTTVVVEGVDDDETVKDSFSSLDKELEPGMARRIDS
ncbi:hypothetical protein BJ170DRAFT_140953 [Xylariales sp. AK1849]|nr:hypothetical protein BJ170DRAFT_140953 [Xylariales sp. AK1849]